jgi:transcription antitermination factor NusG
LFGSQIQFEILSQFSQPEFVLEGSSWYAVHTLARHEKRVAAQFEEKGVRTFLPLLHQVHKWSDRKASVDVPMFSCYAFVRITQMGVGRLKVLRTPGVLAFVGSKGQGTPIPDEQIESLQTAIREKIPCAAHPFIRIGQRVRIRGGSLDGTQGILVRQGSQQSVVISVELLQRSIAIRAEGYDIEPV